MKYSKSLFLIIMVTICLCFSNNAVAAPYESLCEVLFEDYDGGVDGASGPDSVNYSYGNNTLDARAANRELGTRVNYTIASGDDQFVENVASASFRQEFLVTDSSIESVITFSYKGSITVSGTDIDFANAAYSSLTGIYVDEYTRAGVWADTKYENEEVFIDNEDGIGVFDFSGTFEIVYGPGDLTVGDSNDPTVGDSLFLEVLLISDFVADEQISFLSGSGFFSLENNFLNAVKLESVTGGIEAVVATVPVPGAIWLLGAGLIGLAGFRRKN